MENENKPFYQVWGDNESDSTNPQGNRIVLEVFDTLEDAQKFFKEHNEKFHEGGIEAPEHFADSIQLVKAMESVSTYPEIFGDREYGLHKNRGIWNEKGWAFSILSDVQEMVNFGSSKEEIVQKINTVKRVLMGKYKEIDNGFGDIEVDAPTQKKVN